MSKFLLTACAVGLLLSSASAQVSLTDTELWSRSPRRGSSLSLLISPAYAGEIIPPIRYDHAYPGEVIATEISSEQQLRKICEGFGAVFSGSRAIACAFTVRSKCFIFAIPEANIRAYGHTLDIVMRHEHAHCNGWPNNHPN